MWSVQPTILLKKGCRSVQHIYEIEEVDMIARKKSG